MLDTASEGSGERRIGPSVSRDKWLSHARAKLQRGYVLIVGKGKRTANFYSREKGYEMCAFEVARALVNSGEIAATGEHHLGTIYTLVAMPPDVTPARPPARVIEDEDDFGPDTDEGNTSIEDEADSDDEADESEGEDES